MSTCSSLSSQLWWIQALLSQNMSYNHLFHFFGCSNDLYALILVCGIAIRITSTCVLVMRMSISLVSCFSLHKAERCIKLVPVVRHKWYTFENKKSGFLWRKQDFVYLEASIDIKLKNDGCLVKLEQFYLLETIDKLMFMVHVTAKCALRNFLVGPRNTYTIV